MRRVAQGRLLRPIVGVISGLIREESGQDVVEYTLLLTLISLAAIAMVDRLGDAVFRTLRRVALAVTTQGASLL